MLGLSRFIDKKAVYDRHVPPKVFSVNAKRYLAFRPDSEVDFGQYPELEALSKKWVYKNIDNNSGDLPRLYAIIMNCRQILADDIEGQIAEFGVYRGNSAAVLAYYARQADRTIYLFDTFSGFAKQDQEKLTEKQKTEFSDVSVNEILGLVGDKNTKFIRGRFPASIPLDVYQEKFCIAHIDCDLYEGTRSGLEFFYPRLSPGGLLIIHDYMNPYWPGVKEAVDQFCTKIPERPVLFGDKSGTAMIRKSAASRPEVIV